MLSVESTMRWDGASMVRSPEPEANITPSVASWVGEASSAILSWMIRKRGQSQVQLSYECLQNSSNVHLLDASQPAIHEIVLSIDWMTLVRRDSGARAGSLSELIVWLPDPVLPPCSKHSRIDDRRRQPTYDHFVRRLLHNRTIYL